MEAVNKKDDGVIKNDDKPSSIMMNTKERKQLTKEMFMTSFNSFWNEYPRKVNKKKTLEVWVKKIQPENGLFEQIMTSLRKAKKSTDWQKGEVKYIPHPTTWLNGERWNDQVEVNPSGNDRPTKVVL